MKSLQDHIGYISVWSVSRISTEKGTRTILTYRKFEFIFSEKSVSLALLKVLAQDSEDIIQRTIEFLDDELTFKRWSRLYQADMSWDDDPGPPQASRIYYACLHGLVAPTRDLIVKGADVNAQGGKYGNALQAASGGGYQEIVELLLDKGADINTPGGKYGNALQAASRVGHYEIVKLLIEKGANINSQGGKYSNALYAASGGGYYEIAKLLLDKGADVNTPGGKYGNPLQAASRGGHQEIVKLLLDKGADVNTQGGEYGNALFAAYRKGDREIVKLLRRKGAVISTSKQS